MTHDDTIAAWARARRARPLSSGTRALIDAAVHAPHATRRTRRPAAVLALFSVGAARLVWLMFSGLDWS